MVKIIVNKGRKVWDRENRREAKEGEIVEVKPTEATILKFRGHASDAPPDKPQPLPATPPAPPPPPPPPPPPVAEEPPAQLVEVPVEVPVESEEAHPVRRGIYRRRDYRAEN